MKEIDHGQFVIYTRMTPKIYELLLNLVKPFLQKDSLREPVQPECRLAVTLLYLSQGCSLQSLAWSFKLGKETVRRIVLETTDVLWSKLKTFYVCEPNEEDYKQIAQDFWDMPNCIGSIDGKHIAIKCPPNSACDAHYRFTHVDIGAYGSQSDGGGKFGKKLVSKKLQIPPPTKLPNTQTQLPTNKDIFNKRLSRARRTIENAFGILVSRWRVLLTTLNLVPENAEKIVLACIILHNFIMFNDASAYVPDNYVDWDDLNGNFQEGSWRSDIQRNIPSISPSSNLHHYGGKSSIEIRNVLCNFFART